MSGTGTAAFSRAHVPHAPYALPPHPEAHPITIAKQHPYLRYRRTGAGGGVPGRELTTPRAAARKGGSAPPRPGSK
jgi:hypothetical protein